VSRPGGLDLVGLFAEGGLRAYGESITQLAHALQCAALAHHDRADDEVVVAALLHDVGHFVETGEDRPDLHHGGAGAMLVRPFVPPRVAWLIDHHVIAKRYLCTVDARYVDQLSPASRRSYAVQGARLEPEEQLALETRPWFVDAVRLRRWDDAAKVPGATCPPLIEYAPLLERYFGRQAWPALAGIGRGA
jgi:[1-hydroxy-2-(trimethylamino)ethyl]phosphonate dioxygenase